MVMLDSVSHIARDIFGSSACLPAGFEAVCPGFSVMLPGVFNLGTVVETTAVCSLYTHRYISACAISVLCDTGI